jgi:hypothetical protein
LVENMFILLDKEHDTGNDVESITV